MKYGEIIRDLAARGHDWRFYDENFRFLCQSQSSSMPWGTIHGELWLRAQSSFANNRKPVMNFPGKQNLRVPAGYCFKFHKGGHCDACAYSHNCFKRDGNHRVNSCTFVAQVHHLPLSPRLPGPHPLPIQHFVDPIAPTLSLPTPVNPERLKHLLAGYEPTISEFLFHGFKNGFSIHFEGIHFSSDSNNLISAIENPSVVDAKIARAGSP